MTGTIALVGAGEFLEGMAEIDRLLIARVPDPPARVAIVPTAAALEDPRAWTDMGVPHFQRLGAQAEAVFVRDQITADEPELAAAIRRANFVYMSGGSPGYLLEAIRGTQCWEAMQQVLQQGGVLAGCSAGAMVLGGKTRVRRGGAGFNWDWDDGLGLLPGVVIAPHFNRMTGERLQGYREGMPPDYTLVGVDEHTAAVGAGSQWQVLGRGGVSVFRNGGMERYESGAQISL